MRTAGIFLIIAALAALWFYNTGRLEAILSVIKDPTIRPLRTQSVAGFGTGGGGSDPFGLGGLFGGINTGTPPFVGSGGGSIADIFKQIVPLFGEGGGFVAV